MYYSARSHRIGDGLCMCRCRLFAAFVCLSLIAACAGEPRSPFEEAEPTFGPPGPVSRVSAIGIDEGIVVNNSTNGSLATWTGGANTVVSSSTFDPATSLWGAVTEIPTDTLGASEPYGVDSDEAGSLIVAWAQDFQVPKGVFVRRQNAGSGTWSASR